MREEKSRSIKEPLRAYVCVHCFYVKIRKSEGKQIIQLATITAKMTILVAVHLFKCFSTEFGLTCV